MSGGSPQGGPPQGGVQGSAVKVGVIGPTRVGKTTLVTSLLRNGRQMLAGTSVSITPHDRATAERISKQRQAIDGSLLAGSFNPDGLKSTQEPFVYRLALDPGVPGMPEARLVVDLLDYPGGWLDPGTRTGAQEASWRECQTFIEQSTVLLVPIDATVLMESIGDSHRRFVPGILTTDQVEEVASLWATRRRSRPAEPALVLLCPMKAESYFADNGGRRDSSTDLLDQVREVYEDVLTAIRAEAPAVRIAYCPVDTIGCVEILSTEWPAFDGEVSFRARYRVRRPAKLRMKGVDDVLVVLARHLVELEERDAAAAAEAAGEQARKAAAAASRQEGFWRNLYNMMIGESERRRITAAFTEEQRVAAEQQLAAFQNVVHNLAGRDVGARFREL
jgi:hypothetical protein